jgi:uncharacterized protein YwgA
MNRRQIALKIVLDTLEISADMSTFDERLALQKAIYLAQQTGVNLGYQFSWYLRGPYSTDLTSDTYASIGTKTPEGWDIDVSVKEKLAKFKSFIDSVRQNTNYVRELENLASVLFVIKTGQAPQRDAAKIVARMKAAGKDFNQREVDGAVKFLQEGGLLPEA